MTNNFIITFLLGWTVTVTAIMAVDPYPLTYFKGGGYNILRGVSGAGVLALYDRFQSFLSFREELWLSHKMPINNNLLEYDSNMNYPDLINWYETL